MTPIEAVSRIVTCDRVRQKAIQMPVVHIKGLRDIQNQRQAARKALSQRGYK